MKNGALYWTVRGGCRGLAPLIEIAVLEALIHMQVTGFALKSIVRVIRKSSFGSNIDQVLGGAGEVGRK